MGGRTGGPEVAWNLVEPFLAAEFSGAAQHLRHLGKVASLEAQPARDQQGSEPLCTSPKECLPNRI